MIVSPGICTHAAKSAFAQRKAERSMSIERMILRIVGIFENYIDNLS